jgi:organic hydroperoxide reductase OsmC/OhrA
VIELVWDADRAGTGTGPGGAALSVGEGTVWSPDDLLALAAAGCLMRTLLRLAAIRRVPVLGYVATAEIDGADSSTTPTIRVSPCIVVPAGVEPRDVLALCREATRASTVARLLGARLTVEPAVRALHATCAVGG